MAARRIHHLGDLGFGHLVGEHATHADTVLMHVKHDPSRIFARLGEETLQHVNDELHRSVIVVQDKNAIQRRLLRLGLDLGDDRRPGAAPFVVLPTLSHNTLRIGEADRLKGIDIKKQVVGRPITHPYGRVDCAVSRRVWRERPLPLGKAAAPRAGPGCRRGEPEASRPAPMWVRQEAGASGLRASLPLSEGWPAAARGGGSTPLSAVGLRTLPPWPVPPACPSRQAGGRSGATSPPAPPVARACTRTSGRRGPWRRAAHLSGGRSPSSRPDDSTSSAGGSR